MMRGKKNSWKSVAVCSSVTVGVCAAVVALTVGMTSLSFPEQGQGGHDFPTADAPLDEEFVEAERLASVGDDFVEISAETGIPEVDEAEIPADPSYNLSYISYRVRPGDIIGKIAERFGVSSDSIISLNGIKSSRSLQIGTYLKIPTMPGILYTTKGGDGVQSVAEKFGVDAGKLASVNSVGASAEFSAGETLFVPDAKMDAASLSEINGDLFKKPIHAKWYRSSSFGWRSNPFTGARTYHSGIDMACSRGTSIYAAMAGTVTATGFSPVYGNYVIVTHHSGYKTLYGHMDSILCARGQAVNSETRIGKVGSTGMSTGPHLHFTVYKNSVAVNPAALWR